MDEAKPYGPTCPECHGNWPGIDGCPECGHGKMDLSIDRPVLTRHIGSAWAIVSADGSLVQDGTRLVLYRSAGAAEAVRVMRASSGGTDERVERIELSREVK